MRRRRAEKRIILPDPKFNSKLVTKFVNIVMIKGKRSISERIVYGSLDILGEKTGEQDLMKALRKSLDNARPKANRRVYLSSSNRTQGGKRYVNSLALDKGFCPR